MFSFEIFWKVGFDSDLDLPSTDIDLKFVTRKKSHDYPLILHIFWGINSPRELIELSELKMLKVFKGCHLKSCKTNELKKQNQNQLHKETNFC